MFTCFAPLNRHWEASSVHRGGTTYERREHSTAEETSKRNGAQGGTVQATVREWIQSGNGRWEVKVPTALSCHSNNKFGLKWDTVYTLHQKHLLRFIYDAHIGVCTCRRLNKWNSTPPSDKVKSAVLVWTVFISEWLSTVHYYINMHHYCFRNGWVDAHCCMIMQYAF